MVGFAMKFDCCLISFDTKKEAGRKREKNRGVWFDEKNFAFGFGI